MKSKIFWEFSKNELERKVNEFISDREVISISLSVTNTDSFYALIAYK